MNIIFWNTAGKNNNSAILSLAADKQPNIIILAEYKDDPKSLLIGLRSINREFIIIPQIGCKRLWMLTSYPLSSIRHRRDGDRYSIKEIKLPNAEPFLIAMVHLPSKLHLSEDDQATKAIFVRDDIEQTEIDCKHQNTIVIGDFNMNPFEKGMTSINAFNSIPCLRAHKKRSRKVDGREFSFFYNPSWNLLGDRNHSAGTYFHSSPGTTSHYWNTLDQVILRPAIAELLDINSLCAITKTKDIQFSSIDSTPFVSDHLPIFLTINIERLKS